ncbi:MAG: hypothetical protein KGS72_14785 [Cyanobacteria bacterium REEB67]|nr:hypothetical protein [Cyanobacteria bacterium REEB67]
MSKVSTATCKQALAQAWTLTFDADLATLAGKWKRISKRGKKGEAIERVFFHDTLPLQALVVEKDDAIVETIIRGFAPFDAPEESASEAEMKMAERASSNAGFEFLEKYPLFRPCDFLFQMCTEEEAARDGHTWYLLFPTTDFGRGEAQYDEQLDYLIASHLPEGDGEVCEGTFCSALSVSACEAALRSSGFIASSEWTATSKRASADGDD